MSKYCNKNCSFLYYDKENSFPSEFIGEGYDVYICKKENKQLTCYLHYPLKLAYCGEIGIDSITKWSEE